MKNATQRFFSHASARLLMVLSILLLSRAALATSQEAPTYCAPPAVVNTAAESLIRVGYTPFGLMADERLMLASLKATLTPAKLGHPVQFREYTPEALEQAVREGEVDIVLTESPLYQSLISAGLRSVSTIVCDVQPDPNRNDGTAIIVDAKSPFRSLADLKGQRLVAASATSFSGYLYAVRELSKKSLGSPEQFFSEQTFVEHRDADHANEAIFNAVTSGRAEVGFLPLCALEHLARRDPSVHSRVRVVDERFSDAVSDCRHSTPLYPALTLAVTPRISASMSKAITMDLLMLPKGESGFMWSVASDFQTSDALLKDLQMGPYEYLKLTGWQRIWTEYRTLILSGLVLVLALAVHSIRAQWLVQKKEAELKTSLGEQLAAREKMERLQKAGAVGQISGLVAHELRQPLSAITLCAEGLEAMVKNDAISREEILEILASMTADATRASNIVERVRQYAKKHTDLKTVDVRDAFDKGNAMVSHFALDAVSTQIERFDRAAVLIHPLDLELVFANLIKNAKEAARSQKVEPPQLTVRATANLGTVQVEIEDNGAPLTDEELTALNELVSSEKPDGLGLGLAISRSIVETVGGSITFRRRTAAQGLVTIVRLPLASSTKEECRS